jgi:hypothetical protein
MVGAATPDEQNVFQIEFDETYFTELSSIVGLTTVPIRR